MSSIFSAHLHGNENASIGFAVVIIGAVERVRDEMANLVTSRKADEYAPGALHALRKLCAGEPATGQIHRVEVEEWQATFFTWFQRVKKHFPANLAKRFQANAEEDFRTILKCADEMPESFWRQEALKRHVPISFENEAAM